MKCLPALIASSAFTLMLAAGPAFAQYSMGTPGASQPSPSGATNASVTGAQKIPVTSIPNAKQITGAPILDSSGKQFGRVIQVKTGPDGKPDRIQVGFTTTDAQGRAATIKADKVTLDPARQVLVADLSTAEVTQLGANASTMAPPMGAGAAGAAASGGASGGGGKGGY